MDRMTPLEVQKHYDKLEKPKKSSKKLNEVKKYFADAISTNYSKAEALPIIDMTSIMILEYQNVFGWIEEGYKKFVFKGSRGSAKTTFAVQFIIIDMLLNKQSSWFVIMENKVQHSDTTMLEFKDWIDKFDLIWSGFSKKWDKSDGQSIKEWRFKNNGSFQKIKFIGLDEASKGTITPPSGNYWRGFWIEEVAASSEQFGADMDKKTEKFNVLETLRASSSRFFNRCEDKEQQDKLRFIEFWTFNPYNDEDPALEKFNRFLPDNQNKLMRDGWDFYKNEEDKEVYMTTNYLINPYLPEDFKELMQRTARDKVGAWKTICYGMTGSPINTVFSNIFHIMDKQQTEKSVMLVSKGYKGFKKFFITIDIGNGGEGETAMILWGRNFKGVDIPLRELGTREYENANGYDVEKVILLLWNQIERWQDHFVDMGKESTQIIIDYDKSWKKLFEKGHTKGKFRIHMQKEKYKTAFKQEKRPALVRELITTNRVVVYKNLTPKLWGQLRQLKTNNNGKLQETKIDFWDSFNLAVYHIAKEVANYNLKSGKINDKDMNIFIKGIQ